MKILNRYGNKCRYLKGDVVILPEDGGMIVKVIGAVWVGNKTGFWQMFFEDQKGNKLDRYRPKGIKKVKNIYFIKERK